MDKEIAELKAENNRLFDEVQSMERVVMKERANLSRLTAALNDDERAEKVAEDVNMSDGDLMIPRMEGINDYRAMLQKEMLDKGEEAK